MPRRKEEEEEDESDMPWRKLLREGERRTREIMISERMVEEERLRQQLQQQQQQQQQQHRNGGFGFDDNSGSVAMLPPPPKNRQMKFPNAAAASAATAAAASDRGSEEREKLREMLSGLRKDPFDDDLENNDGSFFPCEFCGDPYPVEFIMRHQVWFFNQCFFYFSKHNVVLFQLSCDLNPNPVTAGGGFDYAQIRSRAEANMALSKQADQIKF